MMSSRPQKSVTDITYPKGFVPNLHLGWAATSRYLRLHPIHRWFSFRHSFSPELVEAILKDWDLPVGSLLLDPFVGAGTTILSAKQNGYSAIGIDLSPLALLSTRVKINEYNPEELRAFFSDNDYFSSISSENIDLDKWIKSSDRLLKAFTREELLELLRLRQKIFYLDEPYQSFFLLALLAILPKFSRAVSDGGWFRWIIRADQTQIIIRTFLDQVDCMITDLESTEKITPKNGTWCAILGDARETNGLHESSIDGVITSPPYPNRHDYSRVFQLELLMLGETEKDIINLRHNSLRSNVEAHSPKHETSSTIGYIQPEVLSLKLENLGEKVDKRIPRMIKGYFEDIYLTLTSLKQAMKPGAKVALVVGNVRHCGVMFPVDEIIVAIASQLGYDHYQSWVVRLRGNSAQQMGKYGREPSRETVVMLQLPAQKHPS
jgi:DNA modification methylase